MIVDGARGLAGVQENILYTPQNGECYAETVSNGQVRQFTLLVLTGSKTFLILMHLTTRSCGSSTTWC